MLAHRPTVLFVGHDAYRAGAQIALLHLVRWLRSHLSARVVVLLKEGGELLAEYEAIAPTYVLGPESGPSGILSRSARRFGLFLGGRKLRPRVLGSIEHLEVDLIYLNSVASLDVLDTLRGRWRCPVICHVHELEMGIERTIGRDAFAEAAKHVGSFVAVSDAVADNLCRNHGVSVDRVHMIYEAITLPGSASYSDEAKKYGRQLLKVPADGFVVGSCGTLDWRKGPDVFVQVARQLAAIRPDLRAYFVWVGGQQSGRDFEGLQYDVERLELGSDVRFLGAQPNPQTYFAGFDVFFLSSREDPFPLVCLEAAALGVPVVCFEKAGGMPEFVRADAGIVVPYLDIPATATSLASLADSPEQRRHLGQRAAEKVKAHDIRVIGKRILELIESYVRHAKSSGL